MKSPIRWKLAQAAELKWWQRYLRNKPKDEYLRWKKNYWREFLKKIDLSIDPSESILDAGCGPAGIFTILSQNKVEAIDPLLLAYEQNLDHFSKVLYPWVTFYKTSLEDFNASSGFDTIFCLNAINHVADLEACFRRLQILSKPGGRLILSIDAHNYRILKKIFRFFPGDILHPHQYDLQEYREMLEDSGFKAKSVLLVKRELIFSYCVIIAYKD